MLVIFQLTMVLRQHTLSENYIPIFCSYSGLSEYAMILSHYTEQFQRATTPNQPYGHEEMIAAVCCALGSDIL
jgi:hypothetical protein